MQTPIAFFLDVNTDGRNELQNIIIHHECDVV